MDDGAESARGWSSSGWQLFGSRTGAGAPNGDSADQHDHAAAHQLNRATPHWNRALKCARIQSDELGSAGEHTAINRESE